MHQPNRLKLLVVCNRYSVVTDSINALWPYVSLTNARTIHVTGCSRSTGLVGFSD